MIHNMIFGGGGGNTNLSFSVVSYPSVEDLPTTADENTIAVITTTEVTGWAFDIRSPFNESHEGSVWFDISTSTDKSMSVLTYDDMIKDIIVNLGDTYQYIDGVEQKIPAYVYWGSLGGWIQFSPLHLELIMYQDGAFNTDIFGKVTHNGMVQTDGSILLYRYGELNHDNFVDITPYSTFQYDIVVSNYGRVDVRIKNQAGTIIATTGLKLGVQTITLDVSDINEPIKVSFYVYGNSNNDNTYINNLKFLP